MISTLPLFPVFAEYCTRKGAISDDSIYDCGNVGSDIGSWRQTRLFDHTEMRRKKQQFADIVGLICEILSKLLLQILGDSLTCS